MTIKLYSWIWLERDERSEASLRGVSFATHYIHILKRNWSGQQIGHFTRSGLKSLNRNVPGIRCRSKTPKSKPIDIELTGPYQRGKVLFLRCFLIEKYGRTSPNRIGNIRNSKQTNILCPQSSIFSIFFFLFCVFFFFSFCSFFALFRKCSQLFQNRMTHVRRPFLKFQSANIDRRGRWSAWIYRMMARHEAWNRSTYKKRLITLNWQICLDCERRGLVKRNCGCVPSCDDPSCVCDGGQVRQNNLFGTAK